MRGTKLARLWKYKTKEGKVYLSGPMTEVSRLVVIPNDRKANSKEPDYYAYVVPNRGAPVLTDDDIAVEEE